MVLYVLVLLLCGAAVLFLFPGIMWLEVRRTFGGTRDVECPETHQPVRIRLDANKAASTIFTETQKVEIAACTRWPEHEQCDQHCLPEAISKNRTGEFLVNHVGVIVAGLVSWALVGGLRAFYPVRHWMEKSGYEANVLHDRIMNNGPALACGVGTIAIAYVMTWIMRRMRVTGLLYGLALGGMMWLAVVGATVPEVVMQIPWRIFVMNALFNLLSFLVCGALLGVLVVPTHVTPEPRPVRRRVPRTFPASEGGHA